MKFSELTECPWCGSEEFYTHEYARGQIFFTERFDGGEADNTEMYSLLDFSYGVKAFCEDCGRYLGNRKKDTVGKAAEKQIANRRAEHGEK